MIFFDVGIETERNDGTIDLADNEYFSPDCIAYVPKFLTKSRRVHVYSSQDQDN